MQNGKVGLGLYTSSAFQPTSDEVLRAIYAGYEGIDDGDDFWTGFERYLGRLGYVRVPDAPCICPDQGRHGHMPECGWLRRVDLPTSVQPGDRE